MNECSDACRHSFDRVPMLESFNGTSHRLDGTGSTDSEVVDLAVSPRG